MKSAAHNLPVTIEQVISWLRQCTIQEKQTLLSELIKDSESVLLASEKSLAKDWLSKEEDEAWKKL